MFDLRRASAVPLVLASSVACAPELDMLEVPTGGAPSLIVAIAGPAGEILRLEAFSLDGDSPELFALPRPADASSIVALQLACPLAVFGLAPGPLAIAEHPEDGTRMPHAPAVFSTTDPGARASEWTRLEGVPRAIGALRPRATAARLACSVTTKPIPFQGRRERPMYAVALDGSRVMIGLESGRTLIVSGDGATELEASLTGSVTVATAARAGGSIWLVGATGQVWRTTSELAAAEEIPRAPRPLDTPHVELSAHGEELLLFDEDESAQWFDGRSWRVVRELPSSADFRYDIAHAAWTGPSEALVLGLDAPRLHRFRSGHLEPVELPLFMRETFTRAPRRLTAVEGLGLLMLTHDSELYALEEPIRHIERPGSAKLVDWPSIAVPFEDGILVGTDTGELLQLRAGFGFCKWDTLVNARIRFIVPLGEDVLLATELREGEETSPLVLLEGVGGPRSCR